MQRLTSTAGEEDAFAREGQVGHALLFWGQGQQRLTVLRMCSCQSRQLNVKHTFVTT